MMTLSSLDIGLRIARKRLKTVLVWCKDATYCNLIWAALVFSGFITVEIWNVVKKRGFYPKDENYSSLDKQPLSMWRHM